MKQGKRIRVLGLNFIVAPNACNHARLGFAVSTKYGNAVQRGRLKRCLRSAFRQHIIRNQKVDIFVIPTPKLQSNTVSEHRMTACLNKLSTRV